MTKDQSVFTVRDVAVPPDLLHDLRDLQDKYDLNFNIFEIISLMYPKSEG